MTIVATEEGFDKEWILHQLTIRPHGVVILSAPADEGAESIAAKLLDVDKSAPWKLAFHVGANAEDTALEIQIVRAEFHKEMLIGKH